METNSVQQMTTIVKPRQAGIMLVNLPIAYLYFYLVTKLA